ncbi:MAG: hypothetical protein JSS76_10830 [Bacteroidetes bacterium]|nr:hypothetical protein [Bacteroidota bacterium]
MVFLFCTLAGASVYTIRLGGGQSCEGYGVCGMTQESPKDYNDVLMDVRVVKGKHLQFSVKKQSLPDKAYFKFFSTGVFSMDKDFEVPEAVCKAIGLDAFIIHAGKYDVTYDNNEYNIIF